MEVLKIVDLKAGHLVLPNTQLLMRLRLRN